MAIEGVLRPKQQQEYKTVKKGGRFGNFLQAAGMLAGGIAGFKTGGPMGAVKGAAAGASLGGSAGQLFDPVKEKQVRVGESDADRQRVPMSGAMQRRAEALQTDPLQALELAESEAMTLPEKERQLVLPKLTQARILERQRRGVV